MNCCDKSIKNENLNCPICGEQATAVQVITPKALLQKEQSELISEEKTYRYCKNRSCQVSYFTEGQIFNTDDLKVKATHKDDGLDVPVCYCFKYSRGKILDDIKATGRTEALNDIKAKMKEPGCFCETSNPQGSCCLGNVSAWINEAKKLII
jgi:hypothetical protein